MYMYVYAYIYIYIHKYTHKCNICTDRPRFFVLVTCTCTAMTKLYVRGAPRMTKVSTRVVVCAVVIVLQLL